MSKIMRFLSIYLKNGAKIRESRVHNLEQESVLPGSIYIGRSNPPREGVGGGARLRAVPPTTPALGGQGWCWIGEPSTRLLLASASADWIFQCVGITGVRSKL